MKTNSSFSVIIQSTKHDALNYKRKLVTRLAMYVKILSQASKKTLNLDKRCIHFVIALAILLISYRLPKRFLFPQLTVSHRMNSA